MSSYKLNISRIENLITQYVETNGIDSNAAIMFSIAEGLKKNSFPKFKDIAVLSGVLGVSPDYITGVSDEPEYDDPCMIQILRSVIVFDTETKEYIAERLNSLACSAEDFLGEASGVEIILHNEDGSIRDEQAKPSAAPMKAADIRSDYSKSPNTSKKYQK